MHLKRAVIENSGPLHRIALELEFNEHGAPKPIVLVGGNGGGKTNFLSLVTDALFEAAATHYNDVLPSTGQSRAWFRVVGQRTTTVGTPGGFTLLEFCHEEKPLFYYEKAGMVDPEEVRTRVVPELAGAIKWKKEGSFKSFAVDSDSARRIFEKGVYAYFPASRSEIPFWLNHESNFEVKFDAYLPYAHKLRNKIYVDRSIDEFKQWIISVILESKAEVSIELKPKPVFGFTSDLPSSLASRSTLESCNKLLRSILGDEEVRFVWLGRKSPDKLAIAKGNDLIVPNLDALSGGQSILLGLFGTILRYADQSEEGPNLNFQNATGICVIDEIDSHIHVDLQYNILPKLIRLFPNIQFIVSSHSPLFVLGMDQEFGSDNFQLIEMPSGTVVAAEGYSEFGKAMEALAATSAFNERLVLQATEGSSPLVLVEGETDTPYLRKAAKILDREALLKRCEIKWVGAKDDNGQGFHTGKRALDHTLNVLRANPSLSNRPILLLYDNDANKQSKDYDNIFVRCMPTNNSNKKVLAGVENLLSENSISDEFYKTSEKKSPNGDSHTLRTLRKSALCEKLCSEGSHVDFAAFSEALDVLESFLDRHAPAD